MATISLHTGMIIDVCHLLEMDYQVYAKLEDDTMIDLSDPKNLADYRVGQRVRVDKVTYHPPRHGGGTEVVVVVSPVDEDFMVLR